MDNTPHQIESLTELKTTTKKDWTMKNIISVLALGLCLTAVAKADAAPEYNLVCKSTYDVTTADDQMSVKGPTLTAPIVAGVASDSKDKTRWGVGYSAAYSSQTGKVTITITTARGIAKSIALVSTEMDAQLSSTLDTASSSKDSTTLNVVCITALKK